MDMGTTKMSIAVSERVLARATSSAMAMAILSDDDMNRYADYKISVSIHILGNIIVALTKQN